MISIKNLRYRSLDIPDLTLPIGSIALIGPNGSGKTTFLKVVAGIFTPEPCPVTIGGWDHNQCKIGFVDEFPDRNMLFSRVFDEVAAPLRFTYHPCKEISRVVEEATEKAGISHLLPRRIQTLSGGEKSLVAIVAATIHSPDLLILDEFDSHLDEAAAETADRIIRGSGAGSVLRCTQNMEVAARSDYLLALFHGVVRASGSPSKVFSMISDTCFLPFGWRNQE